MAGDYWKEFCKMLEESGVKMTFSAWCISGLVPDCRCSRCLKERGLTPTKQTERSARSRSLRRTRAFHARTREILNMQPKKAGIDVR